MQRQSRRKNISFFQAPAHSKLAKKKVKYYIISSLDKVFTVFTPSTTRPESLSAFCISNSAIKSNSERIAIMSEFNKFICHQDFKTVLQLAHLLRYHKKRDTLCDHEDLQPVFYAPSSPSQTRRKKSAFGDNRNGISQSCAADRGQPNAYDSAVELFRSSLLPPFKSGSMALERGECMITDSLIDETIESLVGELRIYVDIKKERTTHQGLFSGPTSNEGDCVNFLDNKPSWASDVDDDGKSNPVPEKFSKAQTDILTGWMIAHKVRMIIRLCRCHVAGTECLIDTLR